MILSLRILGGIELLRHSTRKNLFIERDEEYDPAGSGEESLSDDQNVSDDADEAGPAAPQPRLAPVLREIDLDNLQLGAIHGVAAERIAALLEFGGTPCERLYLLISSPVYSDSFTAYIG